MLPAAFAARVFGQLLVAAFGVGFLPPVDAWYSGLIPYPFRVDGREVFVTASAGVSVYSYDGTDADALLKHADAAMCEAKAAGRNKPARDKLSMSTTGSERPFLA